MPRSAIQDTPTQTATASAPFDKKSTDIVLVASDNVEFHVWKAILSEASPVFADMFSLANTEPSPSSPSTIPLSDLPSTVLDPLLRTCYPPPHPKFLAFDELKPVIGAAHKYQMDGVLELLKERLMEHAQTAPLSAYPIALRFDLPEAASTAARHFLDFTPADVYVPELEELSGGDYHRLLAYRTRCSAMLADMVESKLTWLQDGMWAFLGCGCDREEFTVTLRESTVQRQPTRWFWRHYQRMGEVLRERPCRAAIEDWKLVEQAVKDGSRCERCREAVQEELRKFMLRLGEEVDARIAKVPIPSTEVL